MSVGALDIGGTNVRYTYGDAQGNLHSEVREEELEEDLQGQIERIVNYLQEEGEIDDLGIATTGLTSDNKIERINSAEHGRLEDIDLSEFDCRCYVENDATLGALGEYLTSDNDRVLYVTFSTGIGAGLVDDGQIISGSNGNALKIGAYPIEPDFSAITDKTEGCWEEICGGKSIADFIEFISDGEHRFSPEELYELASEDSVARKYIDEMGELNARGLATASLSHDPDEIVLGGSIVLENPEVFLRSVKSEFSRFFPEDYSSPDLKLASNGRNSELVGALAYTARD